MRKKWINLFSIAIALTSSPILVSCKNNSIKIKEDFKLQRSKFDSAISNTKELSPFQAIDDAVSNSLAILQKQDDVFDKFLKKKPKVKKVKKKETKKNLTQEIIKKQDEELLLQLEEAQKKNKKEEERNKIISLGLSITSSIAAGVAAGLGAYFGIKNVTSSSNIKKQEIENNILDYKDILKTLINNQPLEEVLNKTLDLWFLKDLPKSIFQFLKETIFQDYLKDFINDSEQALISKLSEIEAPSKEILKELMDDLIQLQSKKTTTADIVAKIKAFIVKFIKNYLPNAIKNILKFIVLQSEEKEKSSIIARIITKILKGKKINVSNIQNLSDILALISSFLTSDNNKLLDFFIEKAVKIFEENEISYDFKKDFFDILNKTIEEIFTNKEKNELSFEKIFTDIIPKVIELIKIDKTKSYMPFVNFINNLFIKNNQEKWVYSFLKEQNNIRNLDVYLEKENMKHKIIFPKININLDNIFLVFKNRSNLKETLDGIVKLLFQPLIIELSKSNEIENVKKSIFRLTLFLSFIFYKQTKIGNRILNGLFHTFNPYEPEKYLVEFLKKLLAEFNNKFNLEEILGSKSRKLLTFWKNDFDIFKIIKNAAQNNNSGDLNKLITMLENGAQS